MKLVKIFHLWEQLKQFLRNLYSYKPKPFVVTN
jgi:hypothetical protein